MAKCLFCYKTLDEGQKDFHPGCIKKFFGIMIKKTIFTRTGFRGVPVAYGVHLTGVTWPWFSGKTGAI